jgi:hypothetical protein
MMSIMDGMRDGVSVGIHDLTITKLEISTPSNRYRVELDEMCTALGPSSKISPEELLQRFIKSSNDPCKSIWYQLRELTTQKNRRSTIVYMFKLSNTRVITDGFYCTRELFAESYINNYILDSQRTVFEGSSNQIAPSFNPRKFNIAFHFRYGDTATPDPNRITLRGVPLKDGIQVLQNLLGKDSPLDLQDCTINFFSEGDPSVFQPVKDAFPDVQMFLGTNSSVYRDLDLLSASDVLIGGTSSFTTLAAAINVNGVFVMMHHDSAKIRGIDNVVPFQSVLRGNLTSFTEMLCRNKLNCQGCKDHAKSFQRACSGDRNEGF